MLSGSKLFAQSQTQLDHNRLLSLINSLTDGFLALNQSGVIELSNGVALNLLNTNSLDGKNISQSMLVTDLQGNPVNLLELVTSQPPNFISRDLKLKYADNTSIDLFVNLSMVRAGYGSADKGGFVLLFRDITAEKTAEEERDEFISVASHELRTPVAIAEGGLSNAILLSGKAGVPDNIAQVLKSSHEQILFLSGLINDLAMVSRADREKFVEQAAEFDPNEVLASLKNDYDNQASQKRLQIQLGSQPLPKIVGSRLYTREVLQNFVTNAIKYTEHGGLTIYGTASANGVDLSVADTGIGISSHEQTKLFGKFYRSDDSRVRQINGTGLGLYVSRKLAKLMGGKISMQSQLNKGSVFTLHLPLGIAPDKPVAPNG